MIDVILLIAYFLIYSFIGWILESVYKSVLQKKIVNSGFLIGPFCPIYGFGAMIMYLSLKDLTNNIFILFFYGLIILSLFEYCVGMFLEVVFQTKYWDYSNYKFNINGRVCLKNSMYWGVLGIVFMNVIHPKVEQLVKFVPIIYVVVGVIVVSIIMIGDTVSTAIKLIRINIRLENWEKITNDISEKVKNIRTNRLKQLPHIDLTLYEGKFNFIKGFNYTKNREELLGKLKEEQLELQAKLERRLNRLQKAFPSMKSDKLMNFLNNRKKS